MDRVYKWLVGSCALLAVGCGGAEGTEAAAEQVEVVGSGATAVLLNEPFADGGKLVVVEHDGDHIGITFGGPIGSEAARLAMRAEGAQKFVDIYRTLHPELAHVGEPIERLSAVIEARRVRDAENAGLQDLPSGDIGPSGASDPGAVEIEAAEAGLVDKDRAQEFYDTQCRTYREGSIKYFNNFTYGCSYRTAYVKKPGAIIAEPCNSTNGHFPGVSTWNVMASNGTFQDRSNAWNETAGNATHKLSASTWQPLIPAWSVFITTWGGVYSKATASLHGGTRRECFVEWLGVTAHDAQPWVL